MGDPSGPGVVTGTGDPSGPGVSTGTGEPVADGSLEVIVAVSCRVVVVLLVVVVAATVVLSTSRESSVVDGSVVSVVDALRSVVKLDCVDGCVETLFVFTGPRSPSESGSTAEVVESKTGPVVLGASSSSCCSVFWVLAGFVVGTIVPTGAVDAALGVADGVGVRRGVDKSSSDEATGVGGDVSTLSPPVMIASVVLSPLLDVNSLLDVVVTTTVPP